MTKGHYFKKGNKFGKGRPKGSGNVEVARNWVVKYGWKKLIKMAGKKETEMEATKLLLAYGIGKPTEKHEVSGVDGGEIKVIVRKYA